jgi:pyrroloquinoline quinone biosynthesis protein B
MAAFASLGVARCVYVHMNNSNPVLREGSPERAEVERAGWEVAWDGMEIRL